MHYVRNIFCLVVIAFVACLFILNTERTGEHVKGWIEEQLRLAAGHEMQVGSIKFDFPRSVVLNEVLVQTPLDPIRVNKVTLTAPFFKWLFGSLTDATVDIEGIAAQNASIKAIPSNIRAFVSWDSEHSIIHGQIDALESLGDISYKLEGDSTFKINVAAFSTLSDEPSSAVECSLEKLAFTDFIIERIDCHLAWQPTEKQGHLYLNVSKAEQLEDAYVDPLLSFDEIFGEGIWSLPNNSGHFSLSFGQINGENYFSPGTSFAIKQVNARGEWNANTNDGSVRLELEEIEDTGFLLSDSSITAKNLSCVAEWGGDLQDAQAIVSVDQIFEDRFVFTGSRFKVYSDKEKDQWRYEGYTEGIYEEPFSASFDGLLAANDDYFRLTIERMSGLFGEHTLKLAKPMLVTMQNDFSCVVPLSHFILDGRDIKLSGHGDSLAFDLKMHFPKQSISHLGEGAGLPPFQGRLSAAFLLHGPYSDPQAALDFELDSFAIDHPAIDKTSLFNAKLSSHFSDGLISLNGSVHDRGVELLDLKGRYPVEQNGFLAFEPSKDREMAFHIFGNIDIAKYVHTFIPPTLWATGQSAVDIHLTGTHQDPKLEGYIKLINGNFECWETGTRLHSINADFDITHDKIILHSLKALDSQNGTVTGLGEIELISALDYPFHIDLHIDKSALADLDETLLVLSGGISFAGNIKGGVLKGELVADQLDITLTEDSPEIDHNIEVAYVNQSSHEPLPTKPTKQKVEWPVCFDLHIVNNGNISIHSKELNSLWKGDLKITGCNDQVSVNGDFKVLRGEFNLPDYLFPGKKFKIAQGTITFAGDFFKKASLYVIGEMEIENIIAQVILKGPLDNPALQFRSNPPLSQREILSWILFGRGMEDITPYQGAELTQSTNFLKRSRSDTSSNNSILSGITRLKESLGIDRIGIDRTAYNEDGSEEISLHVGKYILPQVFLGFKRNMTSDVNRIGVEANLMKNVKLQAEVGNDTDGQLHLKWKHDY